MRNNEVKNWNNFFLGLLIVLLPFLGLPGWLKEILFVAFGLLVMLFSLANLRRFQPADRETSRPAAVVPNPTSPTESANDQNPAQG